MQNPLPFHNLYVGIIEILEEIFLQNGYTDKVLERSFKKNLRWGSRDRGFVAETVYDIVRWKGLIDFSSGGALKRRHWWDLVGTWFIINDLELPDFEEFNRLKKDKIKSNFREGCKIPQIKHSVSDELFEIGKEELGDNWESELEALNQKAEAVIRVNTLKSNKKEVQKALSEKEIQTKPISGYENALLLPEFANLFKTEEFKNGWFEMQDANSQIIAPFLDVKPGLRVADTCAGGGGKSLHIAALMENKGQIISMDIVEWKLKELKKRAKRNGAHNITTKWIENSKTLKRLEGQFDRVLIDAPCTGIGVLRRNPDAKWKINREFLERVKKQQAEILNYHYKLLKKDGILVYATCSIFPSENQEQVQKFLTNHSEFQLIEEQMLLPSQTGFDGFYMAKLKRK